MGLLYSKLGCYWKLMGLLCSKMGSYWKFPEEMGSYWKFSEEMDEMGSYWKFPEEIDEMGSYCKLPEEMVLEILFRLPAKSVGRWRCVSKTWRDLLSEPQFIRSHLHRTKILNNQSLILFDSKLSPYVALLSDACLVSDQIRVSAAELCFFNSWMGIRASCDGLVLVRVRDRWNYWVLNPITREIVEVPRSPFAPSYDEICKCLYGLGYDSVSHDYKIVLIYVDERRPPNFTRMFAHVYSLKSGSWKNAGSSCDTTLSFSQTSGVFIDGCIHWYGIRMIDEKPAILIFDTLEEKLGELPPPKARGFMGNELGVFGGCLSMYDTSLSETSVWVMKEYSVAESWTKFIINDERFLPFRCLLEGGEQSVIMHHPYKKDNSKYFKYNLKKGTSTDIVIDGKLDLSFVAGSFLETLVSPHGPW